jgi:hypothetical protein
MGLFLHSLLLLPLLGTAPALQQQDHFSPADFPMPSKDMVIDFAATPSLADLIESYCELTGVRILADPATHSLAKSKVIAGFGGQLVLNPADIQSFFESALAAQDFRLTKMNTDDVLTFTLLNAESGSRRSPKTAASWMLVDADELHLWANHDAVLIQSTIMIEGVDSRQVSTNLRPLFSDPSFQSIMSAGSTNSLIFQGSGSQVAAISELLETVGDRARAEKGKSAQRRQDSEREMLEVEITPVAQTPSTSMEVDAPKVTITPLADRPHLTTAILQVPSDLRETTKVLQELSVSRHRAENEHRIWFTADDGAQVPWPRPHMTYVSANRSSDNIGGRLIVQAAAEDLAWIQKAMGLVTGLTEEEK